MQFSTGIVKLLSGIGTLAFIHEQKEQLKADRQCWALGSDIASSVGNESSCPIVVFELLILFFTLLVGQPCSVGGR